ncbi:hypothetical protein SLA2020_031350 [Shorea laevis]
MSYPSSLADSETVMATRKPQPVPWTHEETLHLIQAYQEKWYSLKRGSLKASQWEEVAITVAARCGLADEDAKSATQCRHKMEKLRRRYRAERQSLGGTSSWPYYHPMDALDRGPFPISARPLTLVPGRDDRNHENSLRENDSDINDDNGVEDDDDVEEEEEEDEGFGKSRSINYILRRPSVVNRFSGLLQNPMKRRRVEDEEEEEVVEEEEGVVEAEVGRGGSELAVEIRRFAERFAGIERMRMEIMRETERYRMEMENKRIEMILDSQRKIVDMIARSFG